MDPIERIKTAAIGVMSNIKSRTAGEAGEQATDDEINTETIREITKTWPKLAKENVKQMMDKYGFPNEATGSRLIWYKTGFWKRTIVYRDEVPHNFPQPHSDTLEQVIDYHVPPEKFTELAKFDGSIIVERTKGEVSARCDMEAANILAINMMHKIVEGEITAEQAREIYSQQTAAYAMNRPAPLAEALQFQLPDGSTMDVDEVTITENLKKEGSEKLKDMKGTGK